MSYRKHNRLVTILVLLVLAVFTWSFELDKVTAGKPVCPEQLLCVVFLDVGQGDAIFIQSPTGVQMLIDGGRSSAVLRQLASVMGFFDKDLDYVLSTHPDADHVGGLVDVLERYQVENIIRTENESDTLVWSTFENDVESEGATVYMARRGQRYSLGSGVVLDILFPDVNPSQLESNQSSIVARLSYGETSVLLTGDAPKGIEEYLVLVEGEHLASDVLKVGHHGSRTSTSELFINEVQPSYAIISAGKDNQYGHPHVEVTDLLFNSGVVTYSTVEKGNIILVSDGKTISEP